MPGQFNGANLKQGLITAAPMFNAMAAGYSSGRGPYAYMDQGAAMMQQQLKMKRDQEAAAAAAAAFQGLTPGGMGAAGGRSPYGGSVAPVTFDKNAPQRIGDDTMAALGKQPLSMEGKVRSGLVARGLPEHVADAFVVNFKDESNLNPGINEAAPLVPGSRGGFGLAQWTGPRRVALERYAESKGKPASDLDVQLDFLVQELQGPEAGAASAIMSAKNAPEAAAAILNDFLRPAEAHRARREAAYLGMDPGAAPVDPMADPYVQQLMQVMAMPGLTPEQQSVIQLQLQSRMEMLTTPQPGAEEEAARAQRARDADLLGYERGSPEWRQYVVTGEMPEAGGPPQVETFYDEASGQQYKAQWDGQQWVRVGGVQAPDEPLVNVDMGSGKFEEAFAKGDADTIKTVYDTGLAAERNIGRIDQLGALLDANPTGAGATIKQFAGTLGIPTEGLDEIQAAQALISSLVPEQRQPGSGPMSDADLALFKQSLPQMINQPGGNKIIVDTMRAIAEYDAEGARIVQRMRLDPSDPNYLNRAKAFDALQNRPNPLSQYSAASATGDDIPTFNPQTGQWE